MIRGLVLVFGVYSLAPKLPFHQSVLMPIPQLLSDGLLPEGVHECTIEEVIERFGRFQESDRRPMLARELAAYFTELRSAGIGKYLIVDGSFVTGKPRPDDVDLLLVLRDDVDLNAPVPPFRYNARSKRYVRKHFHFDFFFGYDGDPTSTEYLALFRDVKYQPGLVKGYLKVAL